MIGSNSLFVAEAVIPTGSWLNLSPTSSPRDGLPDAVTVDIYYSGLHRVDGPFRQWVSTGNEGGKAALVSASRTSRCIGRRATGTSG